MRTPLLLSVVLALATGPGPSRPIAENHLEPAAGRLLVASRRMLDPNFAQSVVLLLAYDEGGALGLIVNRPSEITLSHALPDLEESRGRADEPVWLGGPVLPTAMRMLFRSDERFDGSTPVLGDVQVSGSRKLLERIVGRRGKRAIPFKLLAGHAGWAPGQLDEEIERGDWHVIAGDPELVFSDEPFKIWQRLAPVAPGLRAGDLPRRGCQAPPA